MLLLTGSADAMVISTAAGNGNPRRPDIQRNKGRGEMQYRSCGSRP